jgi:Mn2+/Fe2+ NRAMP family transporter
VLFKADQPELSHTWWFEWEADPDPIFIIALIGWMPTAIDLSAWNSLWTIERIKTSGYRPSLRETLRDFNLGYLVSAVLAVMFGVIGAQLMYGSGLQYPNSTIGFADTLLNIYTSVMGRWSYFVIATSGFCIMLGTCIAVFDGYARSAERCIALLSSPSSDEVRSSSHYRITVVVTTIGAFTVIYLVGAQLKTLIDVAMTLSFMVAPVIAAANFYLVAGKGSHPAGRPNIVLNALAILGLAFLTLIAVWYLISTLV